MSSTSAGDGLVLDNDASSVDPQGAAHQDAKRFRGHHPCGLQGEDLQKHLVVPNARV